MKKTVWLALTLTLLCVFAFSACNNIDTPPINNGDQPTIDQNGDNNVPENPSVCQHAFGDWNTVKQATCKEEGKQTRTCSKCSETEEKTIQKSETHTPATDAAVNATCKNTGLTEGSHCSVCGKVLLKQNTIPLTDNHNFVQAQDHMSYKCSACALTVIDHGNADGSLTGGNDKVKYYVTGDIKNYSDIKIVVYGTGDMPNFSKKNSPPWQDYLSRAVMITVKEGITCIGKYAFYCPDSTTNCKFVMADTVKTIKQGAIYLNVKNLVLGNGVEFVQANAIGDINTIYIPKSVKKLYLSSLGNETYFYEGTLEEFYQIELYSYNQSITVREYIDKLDDNLISNIHIYIQAKNISDRSNYWR